MKEAIKMIGAVILIMTAFSFFARSESLNGVQKTEKYFKKVQLDKTVRTLNFTDKPYLDTIVNTGVSILGIKKVNIVILPLKFQDRFDPLLLGYIEYSDDYYIIRLNSYLSREENILVISHESWHLYQLYYKRLIIAENTVIFDGVYYSPFTPYNLRLWEIESFAIERPLADEINRKLY